MRKALMFFLISGYTSFLWILCPIALQMLLGKRVGEFFRLPRLVIDASAEKCQDCRLCDSHCSMGVEVHREVPRGEIVSKSCVLCGQCVESCPHQALRYAFQRRKSR